MVLHRRRGRGGGGGGGGGRAPIIGVAERNATSGVS